MATIGEYLLRQAGDIKDLPRAIDSYQQLADKHAGRSSALRVALKLRKDNSTERQDLEQKLKDTERQRNIAQREATRLRDYLSELHVKMEKNLSSIAGFSVDHSNAGVTSSGAESSTSGKRLTAIENRISSVPNGVSSIADTAIYFGVSAKTVRAWLNGSVHSRKLAKAAKRGTVTNASIILLKSSIL